jgi:flagellar motor switch protein FliM
MSEILNADQIAAMFEAAKSGELPVGPSAGAGRRSQRLRTVDFSRPTKFTSDHQRRIVRAMETFCQTAATRLSAELRFPIELEVINTTQVTWSAALGQLPSGSIAATLGVEPLGTKMLLTAEQSFVLSALECLLGGSPDRPPRERRFSEIDWSLTRRLLDSITGQLSLVWQELGGVSFTIEELDVHADSSQIASVSEPTYVMVIEARVNRHSAALGLLIPWIAIDEVAERISGRDHGMHEDARGADWISRAMATVPVTLRAEVAAVELPVAEVLALAPGSIVRLGAPASAGVSLFAENVKLGRARPGCHGSRRAVQIRGLEAVEEASS